MYSDEVLATFYASLDFEPDPFQREALETVAEGSSVVVTAPTGAGKTLIADGAVAVALSRGRRAFYTTPIKALSNQKFRDLISVHGASQVGLLTGDNVINGDAPVVVMTTEVLRNMIYDDASALANLGTVVLDEVHYLADRHRGSVWEEIIIHLDRDVPIVCLSATIANAGEFTDWIRERRGEIRLVVEDHRPVPLTAMYMWRDRNRQQSLSMQPVFGRNGRPNAAIVKTLQKSKGRHRRFGTPRRTEVIEALQSEDLLPAIYFVFSRKGCDQAARQIATAQLALTDRDEQRAIRSIVERHTAHITPEDLVVLGYDGWLDTLERGAAAHHAGLVPAFKEAVEELFLEGLVKVVVATETLALGINMPARTVVIESLSKFNGESHELLQPSDFTQLTGRAGRRGIDDDGTAVVLHSSYVPFDRVSGIAAAGSNPLRSSFAPTYNMTVNLIARYEESRAHELLAASFANFAETQRRSQLEANLDERRREVATFRGAAECHLGDIWEITDNGAWPARAKPDTALLETGSVLDVAGHRHVLLSRSWGGGQPRLDLVDAAGVLSRIRSRDLPHGTEIVGTINLPTPVRASNGRYRSEVGHALEVFVPGTDPVMLYPTDSTSAVLTCKDLDAHLDWADRARRAERDVRRLERRVDKRVTHDVVHDFDRLHRVLDHFGYTDGWKLNPPGRALRRLYNELDLLLSEALRRGMLDRDDPAEFAALLSIFTYESRGGEIAQVPIAAFAETPLGEIGALWDEVSTAEENVGLEPRRIPDVGLVDTLYGWALGLDLEELFDDEDLRAGDFVRASRQVLDLLRQVRDGFPEFGARASKAIELIDRGIVEVGGAA